MKLRIMLVCSARCLDGLITHGCELVGRARSFEYYDTFFSFNSLIGT